MTSPDEMHERKILFKLPGWGLALWVLPCPIVGFFLCVVLSVIYNFEGSTRTHCGVPNYLPSISAAIGDFTPQRYIWRILIAVHCAPRFMLAIGYRNYYNSFHVAKNRSLYSILTSAAALLHILENCCLITLTNVSSRENYPIHEASFISFVLFSELYMLITCILFKWAHSSRVMTLKESKSLKFKVAMFAGNILSIMFAAYFFWRHNEYCEPGVYSIFAMCEYAVVLSNIAFHATATMDFGHGSLILGLPPDNALNKLK